MGYLKQKFRSVKKLPDWIFWVLAAVYRVIFRCFYRFEVVDPMGYRSTGRGMIGLAWHNRLLFFPVLFPAETRRHTTAVISASRDGQYIADFAAQFGLESLRGSSTRGGAAAQLGAVQAIRAGKNVIFTPDGPRGPRYVIKRGPVQLAGITGAKIVPLAINASSCWSLHSWDGFQIPKPFSKLTLVIGEGIDVPPGLDDAGIELWRRKVEAALLAITQDPPLSR
ncbi:MAG: lysophospholipid acyltransferase family protein [Lentisphaeria bacterium]|nr:lysophospholipid acyltransferase family protein [Lentisphaeria bacterium]